MNKGFFSFVIALVAIFAMTSTASAQQWGRRGGTGYDGGAQSAGQAHYFANVYGRYPNPYKGGSGCMPYYQPPCYNGGGCGPVGYAPGYGGGSSFSFGVSYSNARFGGSRSSSVGVGVGFSTSSLGGDRATSVGVNVGVSRVSGGHWGRGRR